MSKQITAMEDYQKENERLREENAALKNSPTPEELDAASIANEAKNQRIRELEECLNRANYLINNYGTIEYGNDWHLKAQKLLNQKQ